MNEKLAKIPIQTRKNMMKITIIIIKKLPILCYMYIKVILVLLPKYNTLHQNIRITLQNSIINKFFGWSQH